MKYKYSLLIFFSFQLFAVRSTAQNVGIGTANPAASAKLDINSTSQGLLPPRMTTAQRNAINNPAAGLIIFNTTNASLEMFDGLYWTPLVKANTGAGTLAGKKLYGGLNNDVIYAMQPANDGGFFMAGSSTSSNTGTLTGQNNNSTTTDMWVMKTDATGHLEWQKLLGGVNSDIAYSVSATSDGGCIVAGNSALPSGGIFTGPGFGATDGLFIKLSASGVVEWYKLFGGSTTDNVLSVQQTVDGGYIACGSSASSNTGTLTGINGNGINDGWIIKMDNTGNLQWQKLFGGISVDLLYSITQTADGGYFGVGSSSSSNTGTLPGVTNNGGSDVWIIKMDMTGNIEWQKLLGGASDENVNGYSRTAVKQTTDGGYIVVASSASGNSGTLTGLTNNSASGSYDYWIIKLNGFGTLQWQKLLGGSADEYCYAVIQTTDGGYVIAGSSVSSNSGTLLDYNSNGGIDSWILKLNNSGNLQWQKLLGGSMLDIVYSIAQVNTGFVVAGQTYSAGTGYLSGISGNGSSEGWFFKLDSFGNTY